MALIPFAEKKLITPDGNDPKITARIGILHVDAGNSSDLFNLFLNNQRSGGSKIEAHCHIRKDGHIYQYRDTAFQADANFQANDFALSFETQGFGDGEWTADQLDTIKLVMLWARDKHGIPLRKVTSWNDPVGGWGYHVQFGSPGPWTPVAKSCPGPKRIKQFDEILVPWMRAQSTKPQEAAVIQNHVTAAHEHLARADRQASLALAELKQTSKRRTRVWAQVSVLWAAIKGIRAVRAALPKV